MAAHNIAHVHNMHNSNAASDILHISVYCTLYWYINIGHK